MKTRSKLTYSNVVATLALCIAVGGASAFAASHLAKNSVGAKQLRTNAVTTAKIKKEAVTGAKVNLSTLGTVPQAATAGDARTLQGNGPDAFLRGGGRFFSARQDLKIGQSEVPVFDLPGIGTLVSLCEKGTTLAGGGFYVRNTSGGTVDETLQYQEGVDHGTILNGDKNGPGAREGVGAWTIQVATRTSPPVVATIDASASMEDNLNCALIAQATVSP